MAALPLSVREVRPDEHDDVADLTVAVYVGEGFSDRADERVGEALVRAAIEAARADGFVRMPEEDWCWRGTLPLRAYSQPLDA